jgi:phospholipid/cholesterol/gamma-HCH transport system permease protein
LIAGERRWRATRELGQQTIRALVFQASEQQAFKLSLVENLQREQLNVIERGLAFRRLLNDGLYKTHDELARDFGLSGYSLDLYARLLVLELTPLFVALFVSVRSGAALGTEVALLRVGGVLDQGNDPLRAELLPRGIGVAAAVLALTAVGCLVALVVAYVGLYGFSPWGHGAYARAIGQAFAPAVLAGFALKVAFFAVAVATVPVAASVGGSREMRSVPDAAPRGLVGVFVVLALVEGASIALQYA